MRNNEHFTARTKTHWIVWLSCTLSVIIIGYVIASAIPAFNGLVSLIGAILGTPICITAYGAMWLYDNWELRKSEERGRFWIAGVGWASFIIALGFYCMIAGTYGAVRDVEDLYSSSKFKAWGCSGSLGG